MTRVCCNNSLHWLADYGLNYQLCYGYGTPQKILKIKRTLLVKVATDNTSGSHNRHPTYFIGAYDRYIYVHSGGMNVLYFDVYMEWMSKANALPLTTGGYPGFWFGCKAFSTWMNGRRDEMRASFPGELSHWNVCFSSVNCMGKARIQKKESENRFFLYLLGVFRDCPFF